MAGKEKGEIWKLLGLKNESGGQHRRNLVLGKGHIHKGAPGNQILELLAKVARRYSTRRESMGKGGIQGHEMFVITALQYTCDTTRGSVQVGRNAKRFSESAARKADWRTIN